MTNYLITSEEGAEHYFFRPYEGICLKVLMPGGTWSEHIQCVHEGQDTFSVYADRSGNIHVICVDKKNRLIYSVRKKDTFKSYVLTTLNKDIFVSDMRLYNAGGRLNLMYSALYNGETLLVHCILGDHAKPSTIDTLETSHFFIYDKKVYYTNSKGELGYVLLSDEKPVGFNKLYDDAHFCTLYRLGGREIMLFTRESRLFINGEEILYDSHIEMPTLVKGADRVYIMWKSGSFIRYVASFNGGITWSEPMRFMSTGMPVSLYFAQHGENFNYYYGYHNSKDLTLLGSPDIFFDGLYYPLSNSGEMKSLKTMLEITRREVLGAKREIAELNKVIDTLKNN